MKYSTPIFTLSTLLLLLPFVAFGADGFVPLTSLPGLSDVASANNIAGFLNQIYKISIGAAAVLAVLQITRAGLMYMTEESIAEKKEARNIIQLSILGLVLVLSPAIVFGLIDPRILDLDVDVSGLQPGQQTSEGTQNSTGNTEGTGSGQPASETSQPATGAHTKTFSANAGTWIIAVGGHYAEYPDCYLVSFHAYSSEDQCMSALALSQQTDADLQTNGSPANNTYYHSCTAWGGGEVTITADEPICD